MSDESPRRRTSGGGRHVAPRRARALPLTRVLPPARVAQGALVVVLAGALTSTVAYGSEHGPTSRWTTADGTTDVATATGQDPTLEAVAAAARQALAVAETAGEQGEAATIDPTRLAQLEQAATELGALVDSTAGPTTAGEDDPAPLATADDAVADDPVADDPVADDTIADAPVADDTVADEPLADPTSPASAVPTDPASAVDPDEQVTGPSASSDPAAEPTPDASATATPDAQDDAGAVDVPPVTGREDATTTRLRAALAQVIALSDEVLDAAQEKSAADAAAAQAALEAQQAAQAEAAQRAAWAASLDGYANGQVPADALCGVSFDDDVLLRCDAAADLELLDDAFEAEFGRHLEVTDSYRSYAAQVWCRARKGNLCAVPGTSNHGTGVAVDLGGGIDGFGTAEHVWMDEHAGEYHWVHPSWAQQGGSKAEPWHWEYVP